MLACVRSAAVFGIDASPVSSEGDITHGLPGLTIVGLPDASVRESRDRIRSAVRNSGFEFPRHRIIVNLAPADVRKAGSAFDLPIARGGLSEGGCVCAPAGGGGVVARRGGDRAPRGGRRADPGGAAGGRGDP